MPSSPLPDMRGPLGTLPGFIAHGSDDAGRISALLEHPAVSMASCGPVSLASWGLDSLGPAPAFALSRVIRSDRGAVAPAEIVDAMRDDPAALTRLLPPFAAVAGDERGVTMVADSMGFRQLFHSAPDASGTPVLSTSALLAGRARAAELDDTAVAVQSLLGWQLGRRTLFRGIEKLAEGAVARIDAQGLRIDPAPAEADERVSLDDAVASAAALLRASLEALLDDHPDAVLQLTGGQDSRILLSAIPASRRRGLRAMTLGGPGSGDVRVARDLAARYGLRHEAHDFAALDAVSPADAWGLVADAAVRLDGMADPVALAALSVAERNFEQGVRISGLGGEVARGFYYLGAVRDRPFTRIDSEQLASWRMFANESVEPGLLGSEFAGWARSVADDELASVMAAASEEWFRATDDLYLRHRMQRWAGATDTAVGHDRVVVNPMLCQHFLSLASRLSPGDKAHSLFLARLQLELDPELARIPLEGRPAPIAMAHPTPWRSVTGTVGAALRLSRKATQRIRNRNRPPAGGLELAGRVVEHWRENPALLSSARLPGYVEQDWIDGVLAGRITPRPSSVALLTNLLVAGGATVREARPSDRTAR
ncbi:asparagine synthase (glutamine-hydrolysing) [Homoserinimonas aerilata]|uniref:Asparagine synthase (Glutamine-hydrolysing) n=1 Tax=Homoserinimonas aerilata TaxID=1162970 RepID=A0A542Y1R2_9MICO|nr:asparagine synthase-related protein [Homoserinimonas aerilata]TQL40464.1 asparagine synthase (glutamine-hydrolysing) [Homoserinimonas aerilata]TQL42015.1 asparagine synthase (glutamine-hydrolysing) [Homoserinimonas aerilata]